MAGLFSRILSYPPLALLKGHLSKSHLAHRFSRGVFWTLVGNVTWRLLSAISTITVARILGARAFGEYGMIQSTVAMFSVYAAFRLGNTSTKYVAEYRTRQPEKAGRILRLTLLVSFILCSVVGMVLFIASPYLANHVLNRPELATALGLGGVLIFFLIYGNVKQCALAGFESFKTIAKVNLTRGMATLVFCIPLAYFWGVEGAIGGLVIVAALILIQLSILLKRERNHARFPHHVPLKEIKKEIPILWSFALPGLLVGILIAAMMWLGRLFLTRREFGYTELGVFEAANQWQAIILFLPAALSSVILPILSETFGKESNNEFKAAVSMQIQAFCLVTLPIVIFAIGFSKPLAAVFGHGFENAAGVIPILMISGYFNAMNQSIRQTYDGAGRPWTNLAMYMVWALVYFLGCLQFIPKMGALGFALTQLVAEAILLLIQGSYVDFILAPMALRRHLTLIIYSFLLLGSCYVLQSRVSGSWAVLIMSGFIALGLLPIIIKIKEMKNTRMVH